MKNILLVDIVVLSILVSSSFGPDEGLLKPKRYNVDSSS